MSDSELDEIQANRWFDSEAELPEESSIIPPHNLL